MYVYIIVHSQCKVTQQQILISLVPNKLTTKPHKAAHEIDTRQLDTGTRTLIIIALLWIS